MARVVTQALLDALRVTFSKAFEQGMTEAQIVGEFMSTPIPSTTAINTYAFLGDLPIFRKWVGEKRIKQVIEKVYQLINEDYEATLGVHKNQIEDDQIGLYPAMFQGWGREGKQWMDRLADMQARFEARDLIQLTDENGTGEIDAGRVNAALTRADGIITGYVARRHKDVALFAGQQLLSDIACDLAFAELWRSDRPEHVKDRQKDAMKRLSDISAGTIVLDGGQEVAEPRPDAIMFPGQPNTFGRDSLKSF